MLGGVCDRDWYDQCLLKKKLNIAENFPKIVI